MTKEKGRTGSLVAPAVNSAGFLAGALGGFLLSAWLVRRGWLSFSGLTAGYAAALAAAGGQVSFGEVLWDTLRWPLFVWLLGCTALGTWMVPVMFALRGFLLAFCVTGLASAGSVGLAFLLFGAGNLAALPVFFLLGNQSWDRAAGLQGRLLGRPWEYGGGYWLKSGVCLVVLLGCAAAQYWCLPPALRALTALWTGS